jgi:hypothetical protein
VTSAIGAAGGGAAAGGGVPVVGAAAGVVAVGDLLACVVAGADDEPVEQPVKTHPSAPMIRKDTRT